MSKQKQKRKKIQSGPYETNPKHVLKKAKLNFKQSKMKVSDVSSDTSSVQSLEASEKSGHSVPSSGLPSSSAKKLQCDLCRLSYSSDKELTEHLVSLMHHTKLENKKEDALHNCVLCNVEYKNMADYRKHIGLSSHLDEIARLRGEKIEKKKSKHSRWDSKTSTKNESHYKNSKKHKFRGNFNNNMESAPWNYNQNQNRNLPPWTFNQSSHQGNMRDGQEGIIGHMSSNDCGAIFRYRDDFPNQESKHSQDQSFSKDFPMCNNDNNPQDWISSDEFYGSGPYTSPRGHMYEPWGSGMYRKGYGPPKQISYQYGSRRNYRNDRDFHEQNYFENNQYGHWDEESLQMQEKFLASMDESNERRGKFKWHRQNASMDVDIGNQLQSDRQKWGSGVRSIAHTISTSDKPRSADFSETSLQSVMDRKRPMPDEESGNVSGSAGPKTFRSRNLPSSSKNLPVGDILESARHGQTGTPSTSSRTTAKELDNTSADLLQRAERLCKELREKRLTSAQVSPKRTSTKQQETILSQKLDAISQQRQQKYFKGIIKDVQDFSSADSGISTGGLSRDQNKHQQPPASQKSSKESLYSSKGQRRSLDEIRKSLEETVPVSDNTGLDISKMKLKTNNKTVSQSFATALNETELPIHGKQGPSLPQRERRDSTSSTGSKQTLKAVVRPQVLTKDSLKKMINAPRSRDERVHLAKILHSRDDAQLKAGAGKSGPLQLEGLYDNQSLDLDAAADPVTSVIKLEDLGVDVREQILSLIGSSCPGVEEIQLPISGPLVGPSHTHSKPSGDRAGLLSNTQASLNQGKKQPDQVGTSKKKIHVESENIKKKKTKKKDADSSNMKRFKAKDSNMANKNTSTETLDTDCDMVTSSKSKFSSNSTQGIVINLVDSEEEFHSSPSVPWEDPGSISNTLGAKDRTPSKKKKKNKEGKSTEVSSSMESDDVMQVFSSPSSLSLMPKSKSEQSPKPKSCIDKETNQGSIREFHPDKHGKDLGHMSSKLSGKNTMSSTTNLFTTTKARSEQELSLNSSNVREKFPLLLKTPHSSLSTTSPPSPSTAAQVSSIITLPSSTTSRSYAKAVPILSSSLSPSLTTSQTTVSVSTAVSGHSTAVSGHSTAVSGHSSAVGGQSTPVHSVDLQLPPSIHLANRPSQPPPTAAPQLTQPENIEDKVLATWTKSESKDEVEQNNVVVMDETEDLPEGGGDTLSLSSSAYSGEASSQAMAELLFLSEREEQIKQEAQSMELRLTRLHRLLEQAVVQINKCTERRTQLQEEEKDISRKRLALLRDAAKRKTSTSSFTSSFQNPTDTILNEENRSSETPIDSISLGKGASVSITSSSLSTLARSETLQSVPTLSKADWLAKFASFLPPDPMQEEKRQAASLLTRATSVPDSETGQGCQTANPSSQRQKSSFLSSQIPNADDSTQNMRKDENYLGISSFPSRSTEGGSNTPALCGTASTSNSTPTVLKDLTCMYVGSFLTPGAPVSKGKPSLVSQGKDEHTNVVSAIESINPTRSYRGSQSLDKVPEGIIPLSKPGAKLYRSGSVGTEEDSDIGSVASSLASGTSLGEQITQYCRATPGASLDSAGAGAVLRQHVQDLSVIISSDASLSDHLSGSNQRGEEEEESCLNRRKGSERGKEAEGTTSVEYNSKLGHISLEDSEIGRRGLYGSLNQDAVRSAEALHLMERNYQDNLGSKSQKVNDETQGIFNLTSAQHQSKGSTVSFSDCSGNGGGKRKKLLTRQEREASQLTRHRKRWLVSSSSDDEQVEENPAGGDQDANLVTLTMESKPNAYGDEKINSAVVKTEPMQEVSEDITVAECDSSTSLGIVDSESIRQRTQTLREMRESFERTFGRSPRSKVTLSREGEFSVGVNSTTPETSQVLLKSLDNMDDESMLISDSRPETGVSLKEKSSRETGLQRFEGSGKPVCEIQVVDSHLYVGYQNLCISVFDLEEPTEEKISEHPFGHLECFYVTEINEILTVIVGDGCFLTFCSASDINIPSRDMGTPIRCILYSDFDLFLGLDTGEICVINAKTMEQKSRFICSDHLLRSMAVAQEGAMKLLCVAAQDGSISIINSRQGLLLRILSGHVKAAFSLQVDKSSVFSCSMDGTVLEQNLHTTTIEHVYIGHKGIVMAVYLYKTYLLTAGIDKLVRCYDVKTHKLVQVYYGAGRGAITKIIVINNKLITGNLDGVVDVIDFNIDAQNKCPVSSCNLNFGHLEHLQWHQQEDQHYADSQKNLNCVDLR